MVTQKIKELDPKKLKQAQKVLAIFELMGIKEEDLDNIRQIPAIIKSVNDMANTLASVVKILKNETSGGMTNGKDSIQKRIHKQFGDKTEGFFVNGKDATK